MVEIEQIRRRHRLGRKEIIRDYFLAKANKVASLQMASGSFTFARS